MKTILAFIFLSLFSVKHAEAHARALYGLPLPPPFSSTSLIGDVELLDYAAQIDEYKHQNEETIDQVRTLFSDTEYVSTMVLCNVPSEWDRAYWQNSPEMRDLSEAVLARILAYLIGKDRSRMEPLILTMTARPDLPIDCEVRLDGWNALNEGKTDENSSINFMDLSVGSSSGREPGLGRQSGGYTPFFTSATPPHGL